MATKMTAKTKPTTARRARTKLVRTATAKPIDQTIGQLLVRVLAHHTKHDPQFAAFMENGVMPSSLPEVEIHGASTLNTRVESLGKSLGTMSPPMPSPPTLAQVLEQTDALRSRVGSLVAVQADLVQRLTGQYPLEPVNGVRALENEGMAARLEVIVRDLHDMVQQLDAITAALSRQL
ncbi:hypothetical protein [Gemmatimonas sp.]